jgi:hypothetical protein
MGLLFCCVSRPSVCRPACWSADRSPFPEFAVLCGVVQVVPHAPRWSQGGYQSQWQRRQRCQYCCAALRYIQQVTDSQAKCSGREEGNAWFIVWLLHAILWTISSLCLSKGGLAEVASQVWPRLAWAEDDVLMGAMGSGNFG